MGTCGDRLVYWYLALALEGVMFCLVTVFLEQCEAQNLQHDASAPLGQIPKGTMGSNRRTIERSFAPSEDQNIEDCISKH